MDPGEQFIAEFDWDERTDPKERFLKLEARKYIEAPRGGKVTLRYRGKKGGVVMIPVVGVFDDQIVPFREVQTGTWEAELHVLNVDPHKETNPQFCKITVDGKEEFGFPVAIYSYEEPSFAEAASPPKIIIKP